MRSSSSPATPGARPVSRRARRGRLTALALGGMLAVAAVGVSVPAMINSSTTLPPDDMSATDPCHNLTVYQVLGDPGVPLRYVFRSSYEEGRDPDGTRYYRYVHALYEWDGAAWQQSTTTPTVTPWYCRTPSPVPLTTPTAAPSPTAAPTPTGAPTPTAAPTPTGGPTPSASASSPATVTCGDQTFPRQQAVEFALAGGLTATEAQQFAENPCDITIATPLDEVLLAEDGTDTAVVAGPAGPAPCKIATGRVRLVTHLNAFVKNVELASYKMAMYFCYDGSQVWKKGFRDQPPTEAAIQDIQYTAAGTLYQVEYMGVGGGPATSGWVTWPTGGNEKGGAFTITTTQWKAGLPFLKWALPERASTTKKLSVYANGSSTLTAP